MLVVFLMHGKTEISIKLRMRLLETKFYTRGTQYWVFILGQWLGVLVAVYRFIPVFFNVNSASSFMYIEKRFKSPFLRSYCALTFIISQLLYASVVLYAPCTAISIMVPMSITKLLLIVGGICTFYTAIGGIKTVVFTDLFQFMVIFAALLVLLIKGTRNVGGISSVFDTAYNLKRLGSTFDFNPDPTSYQTVWIIFFGTFALTVRSYGVYQPSIQKYVAMPTLKHARRSALAVMPMQLIIFFVLSILGLVMLATYQTCDPLSSNVITRKDHLLSLFAAQTLSPLLGLRGLFIACLFSASLSTLSSSFNSLAAVLWEDFLIPLKPSLNKVSGKRHTASLLPGLLALCIGLMCLGLSFLSQHVEGILNAALNALGVFGGQAVAVFLLGMFCRWANYKGVLVGKLVADIICIWLTVGAMKYRSSIIPSYLPLPTPQAISCEHLFNSSTTIINVTSIVNNLAWENPIGPGLGNLILFKLYSISYLLICPLGFLICSSLGLLISWLTGGCEDPGLSYDAQTLLHPCMNKNNPKEQEMECCSMKNIDINQNDSRLSLPSTSKLCL